MNMKDTKYVFVACMCLMMVACTKPVIEGRVVDAFDKPLPDTLVSIEGTTISTTSNSDGQYSIEYVPGAIVVNYTKKGFTTSSLEINIAQESLFPANTVKLYEIPKTAGIYYIDSDRYVPLASEKMEAVDKRTNFSNNKVWSTYSYKLPLSSKPGGFKRDQIIQISFGEAEFLDTTDDTNNAKLLEMESVGSIFKQVQKKGQQENIVGMNIIKEDTEQLPPNVLLRKATMSPGIYAFSPFNKLRSGKDQIDISNPAYYFMISPSDTHHENAEKYFAFFETTFTNICLQNSNRWKKIILNHENLKDIGFKRGMITTDLKSGAILESDYNGPPMSLQFSYLDDVKYRVYLRENRCELTMYGDFNVSDIEAMFSNLGAGPLLEDLEGGTHMTRSKVLSDNTSLRVSYTPTGTNVTAKYPFASMTID
jgi:hypothetical protein